MKKVLTVFAIVFAAFFLVNNEIISFDELNTATKPVSLELKIARLAMLEPEAKILLPIKNVRVRQIADTWQAARSNGGGLHARLHEGQDIFAARGSAVFSATTGYVAKIGEDSLGGNIVMVAGAGNRFYYYAHLDKFAINLKVGDYVTPETILGFVGNTGNARTTPPHLHFGVYTANGAINPLPLLIERS